MEKVQKIINVCGFSVLRRVTNEALFTSEFNYCPRSRSGSIRINEFNSKLVRMGYGDSSRYFRGNFEKTKISFCKLKKASFD